MIRNTCIRNVVLISDFAGLLYNQQIEMLNIVVQGHLVQKCILGDRNIHFCIFFKTQTNGCTSRR